MTKTMTLEEKVEQWFIDRNLHEANPVKQFQKLIEETGELYSGIAKGKSEIIRDSLGDMQVVLIGIEQQIKNGAQIEASPQDMELLLLASSLGRWLRNSTSISSTTKQKHRLSVQNLACFTLIFIPLQSTI
ncbi:TPA: MazG-like family protein [Streptococcus agalactiae]